MLHFGYFEPLLDQVHVLLRRRNPGFGLLLEAVKDIHCFLESNCVDRSVCVGIEILDDL